MGFHFVQPILRFRCVPYTVTNIDICLYLQYIVRRISLTEGRIPDAILTAERVRMPARGLANRSRAALGHRSAGKRTGLHGACLTQDSFAACGQNTVPPRLCGNPGLGLSHRGDSRWRVPWRSAGRRARLSSRAALPRKRQLARQCAFRRFASLLFVSLLSDASWW
jgi:hypothetical protein